MDKEIKEVSSYQFWSAIHRRIDRTSDENEEKMLKKASRNYVGGTWVVL